MAIPAISPVSPVSPAARQLLRDYFTEVMSRYYRRPATGAEIDTAMRDEPSDDLMPPTGLLLAAWNADAVVGCAGLRLLADGIGEVTRMFVVPEARGRRLGGRLLSAVEHAARERRLHALRLDTGSHLVEACRLYASAGYHEVPAFTDFPFSDRWFEKTLASG